MSDFIQDMKDASERFNKWANENPILDEDFRQIDSMLQKHYDQRSTLFEVMLKILEQNDDSLADNWQRVSEQALDMLEKLEESIPERAGEGLKSVGLGDFAEGEKKVWQENRKATVATMAEAISEIAKNDDDLTKQLQDDLKRASDDGRAIDELVRATFGDNKETMRQLAMQAVEKGSTKVVAEIPLIGDKIAPYASKAVESVMGGSGKTRDLAKKKRAYKDILINNRKKIDDLKEKINDDNIKKVAQTGSDFADSLKGIGSTGDYKAADWESFAKECKDRLKARSEPAIAKAQTLYQTVRPAYIQGLTTAYATLASDPATLAAFKQGLDDDTQSIYEGLRLDHDVIGALRDSPTRTTAWATLQKIQDDVTNAIKTLKDAIKDAEEMMVAGSF